jgi:hypothetical protein
MESVCRSTHFPLHAVCPAGQDGWEKRPPKNPKNESTTLICRFPPRGFFVAPGAVVEVVTKETGMRVIWFATATLLMAPGCEAIPFGVPMMQYLGTGA